VLYPIRDQRGLIVGVIKAENKFGATQQAGFTLADQELLDVLTTQISIAVDKIDRIQKLRLLHESAQMITEVGEQREVLQRIARSACQVVRADLAVILPYDADQAELLVEQAASYGQLTNATRLAKPREHGPTRDTLQSGSGYTIVEDLEHEPSKSNDFTKQEGVRAFIAVALKARKVPVGILYCDFRRPRQFAPEEIRNAQAFGELAAIAISNATLFSRVNRTVQELTAVQQLTKAALTKVDLDIVLETVVGVICDTLGFEMCTVSLVNDVERVIETRAARGIADEWMRMSRHSLESQDIQAWIVRTGQTAVINGWDDRLDPVIYERFKHERLIRVFTPIYGRSGIIGLVEAGYDRSTKATISDQEVATLDRCLEQVALVIESARLLEQSRRHAEQLETLHEMSQQMDRAFHQKDIPSLLELATDTASMLSGPGASAAIHVYERQAGELDLQACSGTRGDLLERHRLAACSAQREITQPARPQLRSGRYEQHGAAPSACVPLRIGGQTLGTLCVVYDRDHWFSQNEQKILDLCATQAATLIVNTRVHRELTSSLDWLSDEIALSYHAMIGPHLAVVKHTIENLLAEKLGPLTPKQADRFGKAKEEIDMLAHRIERLLLLRRLEAGRVHLKRQETQLADLIGGVSARLQPWAHEQGIELSWSVDRGDTPLQIDREKIESVVDELIVNAIKRTPAGGTINVRGVEREQRFLICVSDTGIGIAPSQRARIFEKYYQVSAFSETSRSGIGLGLYLTRKFVELHSGRINVRSKLGVGTTFMVTLPKHRGKLA
jgi:signal transduction histidine kinase